MTRQGWELPEINLDENDILKFKELVRRKKNATLTMEESKFHAEKFVKLNYLADVPNLVNNSTEGTKNE